MQMQVRQLEHEDARFSQRQGIDLDFLNKQIKLLKIVELESHASTTSEGQPIIGKVRSEVVQVKASAVSQNLTRELEAKIESQKYEIQSRQRDLQSTQGSLNSWDEVNLSSTQGVCV